MPATPVYLDNNATTPCDPRVVEAMLPWFTRFYGNASSSNHAFGWQAQEAVELAREQVAVLIGAAAREIVFTSGATESINLALKGVFEAYAGKGNHIVTLKTEHQAVVETCEHIEKLGGTVSMLDVDAGGIINLDELDAAIGPSTILVAVMYANNETGVVQPVKAISGIARKHGVLFFSDATQAVGKIPVDVERDGIDLLALSAHKIYGPKGVGALYLRRKQPRVTIVPQMDGGGQERGRRSGTLNTPGIVGLGRAAMICKQEMLEDNIRMRALRDQLENGLLALGNCSVNGSLENRLPNCTNILFGGVGGTALLAAINKDIAVSSGSACSAASPEPSPVLKAMGLDDEQAYSSIRFGLGRFTKAEEIQYTLDQVQKAVKHLRETNLLSAIK